MNYFDSPDLHHVLATFGSPALVIDAEIVRRQYRKFMQALPGVTPFYSVKTNPHPLVIDTVNEFKAHFDAATLGEIKMLLARGTDPGGILYTHPVKTVDEIKQAAHLGINAYTLDSLSELQRLNELVPNAHLFLRLTLRANASLYDYKRKFGANLEEAQEILEFALNNHLPLTGISFMVGSQSMAVGPWEEALERVLELFTIYHNTMPSLRIVNIGSGFPLPYAFDEPVPSIEEIGKLVRSFQTRFPADVQFIAEPGRWIVGPASVLKTTVARRLERAGKHWLYVDANVYSGLIEILESGGQFQYPITSNASGEPVAFTVAGKTLDPDDMFGQNVLLPSETTEGHTITIHDTGAYSTTFFTDYHSLPHPSIITVDSKFADNVYLAVVNMGIGGLQARRAFRRGETLFQVSGHFTKARTRTSFQVDTDRHIEPTIFGAFLNHSCDPNVGVRTNEFGYYDVVARRPIAVGEDIAADYAMFEYETGPMSHIACLCGSPLCRKHVTGYKDLPQSLRDSYHGYVAAYLTNRQPGRTGVLAPPETAAT
ncbi:MAG TPA: SET domain-containing protein-lysine N-methyltransferase [Candidatus Saccharimonadales bacterium]|nr:SET domain-containing protein-lysine N-methyltransferase [Candidatus Saccharimonadales bacterium]